MSSWKLTSPPPLMIAASAVAWFAFIACGADDGVTQEPASTSAAVTGPSSSSFSAVATTATVSSATGSGGSGGMGGAMNTGGSGGKTPTPTCGDGLIEGAETCDDGNTSNGDGCDETCKEEPGYDCTGEPSVCKEIEPVSYSKGPGINAVLKYGKYNGTLESMECVSILVPDTGHDNLQWLTVKLGIDHGYIGELVIKVRSPSMTVSTLMSIPGYAEPKDDGVLPATGDSSNLDKDYPILFDDSAPNDAEDMGGGLWPWGEVCKDDNKCTWAPNPGSGPGAGLSDFIGEKPDGAWRVCVGDALFDYFGSIDSVELTMLAWK